MADQNKGDYAAHLRSAAQLLTAEADKASPAGRTLSPLEEKLKRIAERLTGDDLSIDELQRLQVETNVLETVLTAATNYHHHDTNQHHDHETLVMDPAIFADLGLQGRGQ